MLGSVFIDSTPVNSKYLTPYFDSNSLTYVETYVIPTKVLESGPRLELRAVPSFLASSNRTKILKKYFANLRLLRFKLTDQSYLRMRLKSCYRFQPYSREGSFLP